MKWNDLTMKERSDLMSLFLKAGIGSLSDMRHIYDGIQDTIPMEVDAEGNLVDSIKASTVSAKLPRNQWNSLYKQGKVSLAEVPGQYQSYIEGQNSEFKKGITKAISDFGENYVAPAMMTALSLNPVIGATQDISEIAYNIATGNLTGAGASLTTAALPDILNSSKKYIKRGIGTFIDKNRNNILNTAEKLNPKYKAWLESPFQKTLDTFNSYASEQVFDAAKQDMLNYHVLKDKAFGVEEKDVPYFLYKKYMMGAKGRPANRLETIINNLEATPSTAGRLSADATYNPITQTIVFYDSGLQDKKEVIGNIYHELNHGAQNALKEASKNKLYKGRKPIAADKEISEYLQNNSTKSEPWFKRIEEFNSEMQNARGMFEQFGSFNGWSPEAQIKTQDFLAERFGITSDQAGYMLDYMDKHFHEDGGHLFSGKNSVNDTKYIIQPGDTLSGIAQSLTGKALNYYELAKVNGIQDPNFIRAGDELIIPVKINRPLTKKEIPTKNKTIVIDNYSPNYNYIVEDDKIYYSRKDRDYYVDISHNEVARKNLYNFLNDKYILRGYEDNERKILERVNRGDFNYKNYRDSVNVENIKKALIAKEEKENKNFNLEQELAPWQSTFLYNDNNTKTEVKDTEKTKNTKQESTKTENTTHQTTNDNDFTIFDIPALAFNWAKRQLSKNFGNDEISNIRVPELEIKDSEYGIVPSSYTGDTLKVNNRRYILPESLDVSEFTYGYRNRGDLNPIESEAAPITSFHPFEEYDGKSKLKGVFIGIDKNGRFKAGDISIFEAGDMISRSFSNKVYEFPKDANNNYIWQSDSKHGNHSRNVPQAIVEDDKTGKKRVGFPINILSNKNDLEGKHYGNIDGGRVLVKVGNEFRLLSGSFKDIDREFEAMKKRQHVDYGIFYTLDNGSYNRGLRTYNNKFTKADLESYDRQNSGGGNFLYIKGANQQFPSDTVATPNIRTVNSASYKAGRSLENEKQGVVLHHTAFTGENNLEEVTKHFQNPETESSAHVVIDEDGRRRVFGTPEQVTFHAGKSFWNGRSNVNDFMIGIEFNGDTSKKPLTEAQINSAVEYLVPIIRENKISLENITTHQKVRELYNHYRKQYNLGKAAPEKVDLSFAEYERVIEALKKKVYYKK